MTVQSKEYLSMVPILTSGSRPPFFSVHMPPLSIHYRLGADQPVYYFKALWNEETFPSEICIKDLAADHLKKMKTVQPEGADPSLLR